MMFEKVSTDKGEDGFRDVGAGKYIAIIQRKLGNSTILFSYEIDCCDKQVDAHEGPTKHFVKLKTVKDFEGQHEVYKFHNSRLIVSCSH